jgi:peroxiredoxin Q/BCP
MPLPLGSLAPDFALRSQTGEIVRLSDVTGERAVVVFFYPRDETPICTAEACAFRDSYETFLEAGADVLGISSDPIDKHQRFAERNSLRFRLLSDSDGAIRRKYEVEDSVPFLMPGRATYVVDRERIIRHHFSSQLRPNAHVNEALSVVRQLAGR